MDGLAGDRNIRSKRWSDSKDFLSDSVSICKTFENSHFYIIGEHSIIFLNGKHFKQKAYAELALSQKSGFGQKIDPLMVLLSFFQELKKYEKKHEEEKKCDTRSFLVKKDEQRMFSMKVGIHNISFDVYISILMMHEKPSTYSFALVIGKC